MVSIGYSTEIFVWDRNGLEETATAPRRQTFRRDDKSNYGVARHAHNDSGISTIRVHRN